MSQVLPTVDAMDHLPKVSSVDRNALPVIPCLCIPSDYEYPDEPQGSNGFREFTSRHGYKTDDLASRALSDTHICAFLQSWLFFGVLRETFARPSYGFDRGDFVKITNAGEQVITTEALPRYVWYWIAARTHDYREEVAELEQAIDSCLRQAHEILSEISQQMRQHQNSKSTAELTMRCNIILSLSLLGDYLTFARHHTRQYTIAPTLDWECAFLDDMMITAGWCIGELSTLRKSCNLSSRYYLSMMDRKSLRKKHNKCISSLRCQAHQLDYNTYRTQHLTNCSNLKECEEVGPQVREIASAISAGGSAVTVLRPQPSHEVCKPEVIQVGGCNGSQIPYVAISHVWSDGRGNPWQNCLRSCQLQYIQNLVNALYDPALWPVPFWMDTLSIPVGREYSGLRQMAIAGIAKTFKGADKVLAIDNALQFCGKGTPWVEVLMRIQYSPWMTRLWTYLEGKLAQRLYFQLRDTVVSADDLEQKLIEPKKLISISQSLKALPENKLRLCTSAIHLIRAIGNVSTEEIAQYARMPPQEDPDMESYRQDAIQRVESNKEYYHLRDEWRPFLESINKWDDLDEEDDRVRADLEACNTCPVTRHAFSSVTDVRGVVTGLFFQEMKDLPRLDESGMVISQLFDELSSGLRGRTTSRIDDETLCLGALFGVDLNEIQQIKTLHWRWRELLDTLDHRKSRHPLVRSLQMNFSRWTEACHIKRMKVLLERLRRFKLSIIFWNVPRLGSKTWTWAPRSLLHKDSNIGVSWTKDAVLGCDGLECPVRAYRLGIQSSQGASTRETNESHRWINVNGPTRRKVGSILRKMGERAKQSRTDPALDLNVLAINPTEQIRREEADSWLFVEFVPDDETIQSTKVYPTWQNYIKSGEINNLAILYFSQFGALVRVYDSHDGRHLARHIRLVQRTNVRPPTVNTVAGTWLNNERWCIM